MTRRIYNEQINNTMKKYDNTINNGASIYEAPMTEIINIETEGILCASTGDGEDFGNGGDLG